MTVEERVPQKGQIKAWKKLTQAKHRREAGVFFAEGEKIVVELIRSGRPLEALLVNEENRERWSDLLRGAPEGVPVYRLTAGEWGALSQDKAPEGVMALAGMVPPMAPALLADESGPLLLLWQVNNPNNLGALLRTADWFGFGTVAISEGSVDATNPKVVRTSMGSIFHLKVIEELDFRSLLPLLQARFLIVGGAVREGIPPHVSSGRTALLMGNESHGLPENLLDLVGERWRIPGGGGQSP